MVRRRSSGDHDDVTGTSGHITTKKPPLPPTILWRYGGSQSCTGESEHEEGEPRRHASGSGPSPVQAMVREVLRRPANRCHPAPSIDMGRGPDHDFSNVRTHTSHLAGQSALQVAARAYTVGQDLVLSAGEFRPREESGARLNAHGLVHPRHPSTGHCPQEGSPRPQHPSPPHGAVSSEQEASRNWSRFTGDGPHWFD